MPTNEQLLFADHLGRYYVNRMGFPPVAGRVIGYLAVCEPAALTINDLADALLASRSAITQAVALLENRGLIKRFRQRGERVDRVTAKTEAFSFEKELDSASYLEQSTLLRTGAALAPEDSSGRRQTLAELADFNDFLAEKLPLLKQEWLDLRSQQEPENK
ncbi:GbsR/MarR family transcriptional regulator [Buchananella hordeovulneris]|uniref:GbsR/MarR family transcriptional regulator n=1 Tax=Buchananella hordeovulneris TaxID=52770 RepID=UPI000F5FCFE5|nr:MarR family transcriptional regulator [Buchananella hordeovulneris]RRD42018.1 MarR family transcriptional regulator [Buchananella hordeovulneris]RRD53341.1 MarR family transcriptional regulator [Buchananella hordeovulneris]